jgi:hypothetical protein
MPLTAPTLTPATWGPDNSTADVSAAIATAASAGGDAFNLQGREVLLVKNGDAGSHTVTVTSQKNNFGSQNTADDLVVVVAAGKIARIGPLSAAKFRDANGLAQVTYDGVTSVTVKLASVAVTG